MLRGGTTIKPIEQLIEPLKESTGPSFTLRLNTLKSKPVQDELPDGKEEKKQDDLKNPVLIDHDTMSAVIGALEAAYKRCPIKIELDLSGTQIDRSSLNALGQFIKRGNYTPGLTINLIDCLPLNWVESNPGNFVNGLINSTGSGLHLVTSDVFFYYILYDNLHEIIKDSTCLESFVLKEEGEQATLEPRRFIDPYIITDALFVNTHLLKLEIPQKYYGDIWSYPGFFSSFNPPDINEDFKVDCQSIIDRNQNFNTTRKEYFISYFYAYNDLLRELNTIIFDYVANDLPASEQEGKKMAETAIQVFTSFKSIQINEFRTFGTIYQKYTVSCKAVFSESSTFKSVLKHYLRPFLKDLQTLYHCDALRPFGNEALEYFINLSGTTFPEVEREIVFLEKSSFPQSNGTLDYLNKIYRNQKEASALTITEDISFADLLISNPVAVYLDLKESAFFTKQRAQQFLDVLANPRCPENLTIVIEEAINKRLLKTLTSLITSGNYPKGTCFILKSTMSDFNDKSDLYSVYQSFFIALQSRKPVKHPELHLIIPLYLQNNDIVHFLSEILLKLIVNNKYLKTLILTRNVYKNSINQHINIFDHCPDLIHGLMVNNTLTTFDVEYTAYTSLQCSTPALRNRGAWGQSPEYIHMPMMLATEFKALSGDRTNIGIEFAKLLIQAVNRFDDDLSVLFQEPFLSLLQKNIIVICNNIKRYDGPTSPIIKKIIIAGQITQEDLKSDTELFRAYKHLIVPAVKDVSVLSEEKFRLMPLEKENVDTVSTDNFVTGTLRTYLPNDEKKQGALRELSKKHNDEGIYDKVKVYLDQGHVSLKEALGLLSIIDTKASDAITITPDRLTKEIQTYDHNKGRFRKFFDDSTTTMNDLRLLLSVVNRQRCDINHFQIKLILAERDKRGVYVRNQYFNFRSGIIKKSVAFFRTGNETLYAKKTCCHKTYSETEKVIDRLSETFHPSYK